METKSKRIVQLLRQKIVAGDHRPGQKFYSQREISELYSVAHVTSGRILDELESNGFVKRELGKGTFVANRQVKSFRVGYIYNSAVSPDYPWLAKILAGIDRNRENTSFSLTMMGIPSDVLSIEAYNRMSVGLEKDHIDGLLISSVLQDQVVLELDRLNLPMVFVEVRPPYHAGKWPLISLDHTAMGYKATKHLLNQGYRRIGVISGPSTQSISTPGRLNGYRAAHAEIGCDPLNWEIKCGWSSEEVHKVFIQSYLQVKMDAVICADDVQAVGVLDARDDLGLLPEQLGVVGANNLFAIRRDLELSTFDTSAERIGEMAMARLLNLINGIPVETLKESIDSELIIRNSSLRTRNAR